MIDYQTCPCPMCAYTRRVGPRTASFVCRLSLFGTLFIGVLAFNMIFGG